MRLVRTILVIACAALAALDAPAATHVTGSYDLGSNPRVMTTVSGTPEYGLVFVQLTKSVTYGGVQYGMTVVKGYLDANGQLNDGNGNAWLDLIPNSFASPADSVYVVTLNIQGRVQSEIWVVPDLATASVALCRRTQVPSSSVPAIYYQALQKDGIQLAQRSILNFTGAGVNCSDNATALRTDCVVSASDGGSGSAPVASPAVSGTVKTEAASADPVVYLKSTTNSLLAAKANASHTHAESDVTNLVADLASKVPSSRMLTTTAPLAGGGSLMSDLTLSLPAASSSQDGYLKSSDWSAFNAKENALAFNAPLSRAANAISCPGCVTSVSANAPLSSTGGTTPAISIATASASAIGAGNVAGTANQISVSYSSGTGTLSLAPSIDLSSKNATAPVKATTIAAAPATCMANRDLLIQTDAAPAGQQLFTCNSTGNGWNKVGDGGGGGGGIASLNGLTASDQSFGVPGTSGTAPNWSSSVETHTLNIPMASAPGVTAGLISNADFSSLSAKPALAAAGAAGAGPSEAGQATTAARSDHDHRSIHTLSWFFPGTPATGVQNLTLTLPDGVVNLAILNLRVTANSTSASGSSFNLRRCTAACSGISPTFADIYSTPLALSANTRTAAVGSAPNQNVASLTAGDQFKVNIVSVGPSLADVTVTMTYKYDTTN